MTGACIIDGTDIATLGMFIVKGGDSDFLSFPERKDPPQNSWFEEDGLDVDLTDVYFEPKKVQIRYYISANDSTAFQARLNAFETLHYQVGYRQIYVREFDFTFSLRFVGVSDYKHSGGIVKSGKKSAFITLDYMMDNPLQLYNAGLIPISVRQPSHVLLNSIDFSAFGIVIQDIYSTALRMRIPKLGFALSFEKRTGLLSDTVFVPSKSGRKITVECTMLASSLGELKTNMNALFNQMTLAQALEIELPNTTVINCYYKSTDNFIKEFAFNSLIKLKFNLQFVEV